MSQTKREQVISHLRYLRQELREMHLDVNQDGLFPEPGELRGMMAQISAKNCGKYSDIKYLG